MVWVVVCLAYPSTQMGAQSVRSVPSQYGSIQSAIDVAQAGDTVLIAPGVYSERIDFHGKQITVQGDGPGAILDGRSVGPVVTFSSHELRSASLRHLTIRNGGAPQTQPGAGGIFVQDSSPTIADVSVIQNVGCGIGIINGSPLIQNSLIAFTTILDKGCLPEQPLAQSSQYYGGAIAIFGTSIDGTQAEIEGNIIRDNTVLYGAAGVLAVGAGRPVIKNNAVFHNTGHDYGVAVTILGDTSASITQNLIYANTLDPTLFNPNSSDNGAGLNIRRTAGKYSSVPLAITNNTIVDNQLLPVPGSNHAGSQVSVTDDGSAIIFANNIIAGNTDASLVDCLPLKQSSPGPPIFENNDIYNPMGVNYGGICPDVTGATGNFSADPLFANPSSSGSDPYQLSVGSSAIDHGTNGAFDLPPLDLLGQPRAQNATGTPTAIVDLGAYEYPGIPTTLPPPPPIELPPSNDFVLSAQPSPLQLRTQFHSTINVTATPIAGAFSLVALDCAPPLPRYLTCTFQQSSLDLSGNKAQATALVIDTSAVLGYRSAKAVSLLVFALLLPFGCLRSRMANSPTRVREILFTVAVLSGLLTLSSCSGKYPSSTPPGQYSIVITGRDSSSQLTRQVMVFVSVLP